MAHDDNEVKERRNKLTIDILKTVNFTSHTFLIERRCLVTGFSHANERRREKRQEYEERTKG